MDEPKHPRPDKCPECGASATKDDIGLTVEKLESDAIGKLVEAAKQARDFILSTVPVEMSGLLQTQTEVDNLNSALRPFTPEAK